MRSDRKKDTKIFSTQVSNSMYQKILEAAAQKNMNRSEFVRYCLVKQINS